MEKSKEQQCRNEDKKDDHLKRGRPRKNKKIPMVTVNTMPLYVHCEKYIK